MQTPKSKVPSLEVPPRKSPAALTRTARQLKTSGPDSDTNKPSKTPKTSPKIPDRRSPRSPVTEKKRPSRAVSELESQLTTLQEQLGLARREAEEARGELRSVSARLEESERRISEISRCEDERVLELRALSQERDKAWQSELEAVRGQHSMDSAALVSAAAEIQRLKTDRSEELSDALELIRKLRDELEARQAEEEEVESELERSRARVESLEGLVGRLQAHAIKKNDIYEEEEVQELRTEIQKLKEDHALELSEALELVRKLTDELGASQASHKEAESKLEQSRDRIKSLEGLVGELQAEERELRPEILDRAAELTEALELVRKLTYELEFRQVSHEETMSELEQSKARVGVLEGEISMGPKLIQKLREAESELEQSRAHAKALEDLIEKLPAEAYNTNETKPSPELELVQKLREELTAHLAKREEAQSELEQSRVRVNSLEGLVGKLQAEVINGNDRDSRAEAARLRTALDGAEVRYQEEFIRSTLQTRSAFEEAERARAESAQFEAQLRDSRARAEELEARLMDKETERQSVSEESDDVAAVEAELRRVKVQAEQWRKAAEAAAAILDDGGSDDESLKKKNGNVLKKFGVLWKKGQK